MNFTATQRERLLELGCPKAETDRNFLDAGTRNKTFALLEKQFARETKERIRSLFSGERQPSLSVLRERLSAELIKNGFTRVETPTVISKEFLRRMSLDSEHPLNNQVFWIDANRCLRPMLAPNLYYISKSLLNVCEKPLRVFEIGSCFRKDSSGAAHMEEFTMLNLAEWGTELEARQSRIRELAALVMKASGIADYAFETEESTVYGETLDVMCGGLELGSSSMGPHPLDAAWGITDSWVGIGFGLERLLAAREKNGTIRAYGRSITYLDGSALNVK
ncbi:MAG: pyrrolysine--tRNA(Pyl) ligase large subunit [Oscillospiraceae bacterium]|jgi:phenylalanyl-tRNA synthetase alpha chain|nr:pyrrolysine--tRNA(Pyl) ligase large subunit [Oscillospiraceae bacterium]